MVAVRRPACADFVRCVSDPSRSNANETLAIDQFVKIPLCYPSTCDIEPYSFTEGVYKDLAEKFKSTVGQIQMPSPTYNYSHVAEAGEGPTIIMAINCHLLADNYTVIS